MDVGWAHLLSQGSLMANPAEFRDRMKKLIYDETSDVVDIEFDEITNAQGQVVRVPRARAGPAPAEDGKLSEWRDPAGDAAKLAALRAEVEHKMSAAG